MSEERDRLVREALGDGVGFFEPDELRDGYRIVGGKVVYTEAARRRLLEARYEQCGIPRAFYLKNIDDFWDVLDAEDNRLSANDVLRKAFAKKVTRAYADRIVQIAAGWPLIVTGNKGKTQEVRSLMLDGGRSSGKTLLASHIAMAAVRAGLKVQFYKFRELTPTFASYYDGREDQQAVEAAFKGFDLVVLDGVSAGADDRWSGPLRDGLERISESRADSGKPTVITCAQGMRFTDAHPLSTLAATCQRIGLPGLVAEGR